MLEGRRTGCIDGVRLIGSDGKVHFREVIAIRAYTLRGVCVEG